MEKYAAVVPARIKAAPTPPQSKRENRPHHAALAAR